MNNSGDHVCYEGVDLECTYMGAIDIWCDADGDHLWAREEDECRLRNCMLQRWFINSICG